jgi:hypothetical protein
MQKKYIKDSISETFNNEKEAEASSDSGDLVLCIVHA